MTSTRVWPLTGAEGGAVSYRHGGHLSPHKTGSWVSLRPSSLFHFQRRVLYTYVFVPGALWKEPSDGRCPLKKYPVEPHRVVLCQLNCSTAGCLLLLVSLPVETAAGYQEEGKVLLKIIQHHSDGFFFPQPHREPIDHTRLLKPMGTSTLQLGNESPSATSAWASTPNIAVWMLQHGLATWVQAHPNPESKLGWLHPHCYPQLTSSSWASKKVSTHAGHHTFQLQWICTLQCLIIHWCDP